MTAEKLPSAELKNSLVNTRDALEKNANSASRNAESAQKTAQPILDGYFPATVMGSTVYFRSGGASPSISPQAHAVLDKATDRAGSIPKDVKNKRDVFYKRAEQEPPAEPQQLHHVEGFADEMAFMKRMIDAEQNPLRKQILINLGEYLGDPYVWGGECKEEGGVDCSGLGVAALRALPGQNIIKGRPTASGIHAISSSISPSQVQAADILYLPAGRINGSTINHIMYALGPFDSKTGVIPCIEAEYGNRVKITMVPKEQFSQYDFARLPL